MIKLTVKTLDSNNHTFEVEAESTVGQLKEKIREALGLELDRQRLIFCGRVLQDDQILNESGIDHGKCLHLVQRAPPSPPSRRRDRDNQAGDHGGRRPHPFQNLTNLMAPPNYLVMEQQMAARSPTAGRLNFIHGIIMEIRSSMAVLRSRTGSLVNDQQPGNDDPGCMDTDSSGQAQAQPADEATGERDGGEDEDNVGAQARRLRRPRTVFQPAVPMIGPNCYANPRDLGRMLEELDRLHEEFAPYRAHYVSMLRTLGMHNYPESARQQRQDVVRLICDIMHSFAHCYHSISDITFNVGLRYPRLTSEPPSSTRHAIPVQAQINVVTATGPHPMPPHAAPGAGSGGATATSAGTAPSATATATASTAAPAEPSSTPRPSAPPPAAPATDLQSTSESFNVRRTSATDRTPIHTTTRTITRPAAEGAAPASYQVEIETRGHIAIPLDGNLLSGLAAVASNLRQAQGQHDRAIADAEAARAAANGARLEADPVRLPTASRRINLPPALIALENLDPWGLIGAVASSAQSAQVPASAPTAPAPPPAPPAASEPAESESLLYDPVRDTDPVRFEEFERQAESRNLASAAAESSAPAAPTDQTSSGSTFLGSTPINVGPRGAASQRGPTRGAGGATGGAAAGGRGATRQYMRARTPATARIQPHVHIAGVPRQLDIPADGTRPRLLMDLDNLMRNLTGGLGMEVVMSMEDVPNVLAGAGADADVNDAGAPWTGSRPRPANTVYPYAMACVVYDRYLQCDSTYAHQHLQERRELYQRQVDEEQRARDARPAAPDIELLPARNRVFTANHMSTMQRLLNDPITEQGQLNAFMITIARRIFLYPTDLRRDLTDTTLAPTEFGRIRIQLREYVNRMLERTPMGTRIDTFDAFTNRLIAQIADFLSSLPDLQTREAVSVVDVDPTASLRALAHVRLPTVIGCIMSDVSSNMSTARFYSVMYRFFADVFTLFMCFIDDGFEGLVRRYDNYVANITENYGSSTRDWLRLVAHENLVAIQPYIMSHCNRINARSYLRQADGSSLPQYVQRGDPDSLGEQCRLILPMYCEQHLKLLLPLQAPPLRSPPGHHSSRGSTPTTTTSEEGQGESAEQEEDGEAWMSGEESQASAHGAGPTPQQRSEDSSANASPSHSRSEAQAEAEQRPESADSEASPRRLRRWGRQSVSDSQSLASDLTSESHPPGLIAIGLCDTDSLFDVEDLDVAALVDEINPFVGEYTEIRRSVVYSPMNIIEDDADDALNGIETIEEDPSLIAEDLGIRRRREKRERSIRRDVARRQEEGEIRHKRFITMEETEIRLDLRAMRQSGRKMDFDNSLHMALNHVVEERRLLEEAEEQALDTDEYHDEISEEEPSNQENLYEDEDYSAQESDEDPDNLELERMQHDLELMNEELEILSEHPLLHMSLAEAQAADEMAMYMRQAGILEEEPAPDELLENARAHALLHDEPAVELLEPEPNPARVRNHETDDFELLYLDHIALISMSQLDINEPEFPAPVPQSNDAVRDGDDFESYDESGNRADPAANHGPEQNAEDDWYSLPTYRFPYAELDHDGYYSPQFNMYHERPGYLTPQPIRGNAAPGPSAATTKSVSESDLSEEGFDYDGYDDFNSMVARLRMHTVESSEPEHEHVELQTPQTTKQDEKQQATEIAENTATGYIDLPQTSDDLDLAPPQPMDVAEDEQWRNIIGRRWEPVLRADRAAQARPARPQPPFSDAYLAGMPARKRRCLRDSRPEATLDALLGDELRGVAEAGGEAQLARLLRESVRDLVAARARDQPHDFDPARYPNAAALLAPADSTKEPDEKSPTPPPKSDPPDSQE